MHLLPDPAHPDRSVDNAGEFAAFPSAFDRPRFRYVTPPDRLVVVAAPHGATGHCNRTSSGPVPRPLPERPAGVPWPSIEWHTHYVACPHGWRCHHRFEFPDWWLAMRNRGVPFHEDADAAMQEAVRRVNGYKGHPMLQPEPQEFTQKAVLDCLALAPTPIGNSWMACTLASISGLTRWAHITGQPLTREHLFSEETRYRFFDYLNNDYDKDLGSGSKNLMWVRLELCADFLLGATGPREFRKPTITEEAPRSPLSTEQQADLWVWAKTLSVKKRAKRMTAMLALGLGCGLTGGELPRVVREDVTIDADGSVHVTVTSTKSTRTVTCLAQWEARLAAIVRDVQPGHFVLTPWRTEAGNYPHNESVRRAMAKNPPAVFNSIRLRNTWLCWHLAHGTPLKELMQSADMLEANHLHNLLPLMPDTDPERTARLLRGNPQRPPVTFTVPDTNLSITVGFESEAQA